MSIPARKAALHSNRRAGDKTSAAPLCSHFNGRAAREQEIARARGSEGHRRVTGLSDGLVRLYRMAVAVLLPARLVFFRADGLFLAIADGVDAVGRNAELHEIILDGSGAAIAEEQVVLCRTAAVAVALDVELDLRVLAKVFGGMGQAVALVGADVSLVEIKVDGVDVGEKLGILVAAWRRRRWRRRSGHGDPDAGISRTAGTASGNRVGRGISRRHLGGTLRGDGADFRRDR